VSNWHNRSTRPRLRAALVAVVFLLAAIGVSLPTSGAVAAASAASAAAAGGREASQRSCSDPKPGYATCFAIRRTDVKAPKGARAATDSPAGFGPADLQSAYNLPADGGAGQTVAIVDAYDDPTAEADLAFYREHFGLPACTTANGCFKKVDQRGGSDYPDPDPGWAGEISLDLDMVSAIAPNAHLLLVEADSPSFLDLGTAVDKAVELGAKYVSNSYGSTNGENPAEVTDTHFDHPGVAMVAASGDDGYGLSYPAASPHVTAAGGTSLVKAPNSPRGWTETAWSGAGSGCSAYQPKPVFQLDTGCATRAVADVSAVADNRTPVAVYQTYGNDGWAAYGGTSVAAPIIAGTYAVAGTPIAGTYPNAYPYAAIGSLNDVTGGSNGSCEPAYLCQGTTGYDGPTGLGTPNGAAAFRTGPHGVVSGVVTDSSSGDPIAGAVVKAGINTAQTDSTGTYSLSLPVGSYELSVEAYAHTGATADGVTIADGATVTKDFALDPTPSQTISGKVTDGSGHGWPLYAKITVDGVPGGPVWTDPVTGAYSMSLPINHAYTLHVTSSYAGYQALTKTVTVADEPLSVALAVPVDPRAGTAPGYTTVRTGATEAFDSTTSAPAGWSVVNAEGTTGGWQFDDPGSRGNKTGGSGGFAIADSDHFGGGVHQDTALVSPVYDFSAKASPEFSFDTEYRSSSGQTASVEATDDDGATWSTVWSTSGALPQPSNINRPLTDFAHKAAVRLRFHFTGSFGWWWALDNVFIGQRDLKVVPQGLIVGTVTDANTGNGVVGATVTNQAHPTQTATSIATPDDPELGDGFYYLPTADFGTKTYSASASHYSAVSQTAKGLADSAVERNFSLAAGQVTVTPASVVASVGWGKSVTKKLTVKNTGGAPATVKLGEQSGGFSIQATGGAAVQRTRGTFSPLSSKVQARTAGTVKSAAAAPSDDAWQAGPDLPVATMDNAVAVNAGKVYSAFGFTGSADTSDLYSLDPVAGVWTKLAGATDTREAPARGFVNGKLYATGGWGANGRPDAKLEIYDPETNKWTTGASAPKPYAGPGSAVLDGKLYMIGGCSSDSCGTTDASAYDPESNSWKSIAAYPEPISWQSCAGIAGALYCAGGTTDAGDTNHAYVYDPGTDAWSPIASLPISLWGSAYTSANGRLIISDGVSGNTLTNQGFGYDPAAGTWSTLPNSNVATYRGGGALGFYTVGGNSGLGGPAPVKTTELLAGYNQEDSADVSWLSESSQELTVAPGKSSTVTLTLDAAVSEITQPGVFTAALALTTDTPYSLPKVPVTMTVAPPTTWGKISGTVLGATSGGTTAISGATVQINTWATSYTLKTAKDGTYALWLDVRNNPLTLIVAKDGYQPTVATVKVTKGGTVTSNFTLKKG
jgi:carboxypeptidase family protein/Kelch motif protein